MKSEFFDLRVRVNLAYFHSHVKDAQCSVGRLIPGTSTIAPRYQNAASVLIDGAEFDFAARPLPGLGRTLTTEPNGYSPSHGILNGRTSLTFDKNGLEVALYVKNLTNKRYPVYPNDVVSALGFIWTSSFNPPRTFGAEVKVEF